MYSFSQTKKAPYQSKTKTTIEQSSSTSAQTPGFRETTHPKPAHHTHPQPSLQGNPPLYSAQSPSTAPQTPQGIILYHNAASHCLCSSSTPDPWVTGPSIPENSPLVTSSSCGVAASACELTAGVYLSMHQCQFDLFWRSDSAVVATTTMQDSSHHHTVPSTRCIPVISYSSLVQLDWAVSLSHASVRLGISSSFQKSSTITATN